jgi:hypothetical protein
MRGQDWKPPYFANLIHPKEDAGSAGGQPTSNRDEAGINRRIKPGKRALFILKKIIFIVKCDVCMAVEIVTKEDLQIFRRQLVEDFRTIINESKQSVSEDPKGYKTSHVRKILGCSVNKLVALRIQRKIRMKKIGGTNYYNKEDVKRLLEDGF